MGKKKKLKHANNFPMEEIPRELQTLILEKMDYLDFVIFDFCSQFSSAMCVNLPTNMKIHFAIQSLQISNGLPILLNTRYGKRHIAFDTTQPGIIFDAKELVFNTHEIEFFKRNIVIPGTYVMIRVPMKKADIQEFLQVVSTLNLRVFFEKHDKDVYLTPEIQKLEKLIVYNCGIEDNTLLSLPMTTFSFGNQSNITTRGIIDFLKQWIAGERNIVRVQFGVSLELFNLNEMMTELNATELVECFEENEENLSEDKKRNIWVSKDRENHKGCLRVSLLWGRLEVHGNEKCPKRI